jgi:NAD(P)-dependent dehydrogenase (short-subunit alcohol dehydrogenase family)
VVNSATQRVVAITGASRGIGYAVADRFGEAGCQLVLCDLDELAGPDRLQLERGDRSSPHFVRCDVSHHDNARAFINDAVEQFGGIDVLVTNAGIHRYGPSEFVSAEDWSSVLSVNLTGTFNCIQAVLPIMLHQGRGRIITISSELGLTGMPGYAAYCASKGGVIALTKALAREYVSRGILINSVAPGPILTDLLRNSPEYDPSSVPDLPIGRYGQPKEIAEMVYAIAGDAGSFLVGQTISPNGGAVI